VSKKIIELHGGIIDIKNKAEGTGVRATVLLKPVKE
jgi:nitrogen fixation/metabolism regulation signal transduction histidine kinase